MRSSLYWHGLCPHPSAVSIPEVAAEGCVRQEGQAASPLHFFAEGVVYLDGSCTPHMCAAMARAAWVAVPPAEEAADGQWRALLGAVPAGLPQSAQAAEHLALLEAARELPRGGVRWAPSSGFNCRAR